MNPRLRSRQPISRRRFIEWAGAVCGAAAAGSAGSRLAAAALAIARLLHTIDQADRAALTTR